jgi:hypothetical protein
MFGTKRKFCRVYFLAWVLLLGYSSDSEAQSLHAIEDKLAIAEQLANYSYRWDAKDAEGFSDLFADDGVMERCRVDELVKTSRVTGRQAIFDYAKRSYEGRLADRQSRHHFSALVFRKLSESVAITENLALITHQTEDSRVPFVTASGIYRNTWTKTSRGWKISKRVLCLD